MASGPGNSRCHTRSHLRHSHLSCFSLFILVCVLVNLRNFPVKSSSPKGTSPGFPADLNTTCHHSHMLLLILCWVLCKESGYGLPEIFQSLNVLTTDLFSILHGHRFSLCQQLSICVVSKVQVRMAVTLNKVSKMFNSF